MELGVEWISGGDVDEGLGCCGGVIVQPGFEQDDGLASVGGEEAAEDLIESLVGAWPVTRRDA